MDPIMIDKYIYFVKMSIMILGLEWIIDDLLLLSIILIDIWTEIKYHNINM